MLFLPPLKFFNLTLLHELKTLLRLPICLLLFLFLGKTLFGVGACVKTLVLLKLAGLLRLSVLGKLLVQSLCLSQAPLQLTEADLLTMQIPGLGIAL